MQFTAQQKPVEVNGFPIEGWEDMGPALHWTRTFGFYGMITVDMDGRWMLSVTRPGEERTMARIDALVGQVMVWNGLTLLVMDQDAFNETYDVS